MALTVPLSDSSHSDDFSEFVVFVNSRSGGGVGSRTLRSLMALGLPEVNVCKSRTRVSLFSRNVLSVPDM